MSTGYKYWAFISYGHADNKHLGRQWATWLHQLIETYEIPEDLVGQRNEQGDEIPARIYPVFRDEEELQADASLSAPINRALRSSRLLVVICSPTAAGSRFVENEIRTFKTLGRADRIIALIIRGEPNIAERKDRRTHEFRLEDECFPTSLRREVDKSGNVTDIRTEPVAADFRLENGDEGWTSPEAYRQAMKEAKVPGVQIDQLVSAYTRRCDLMKLKIIAGILGLPLGMLTKRDKAYQLQTARQRARNLRRWLVAVSLATCFAIVAGLFAFLKRQESERHRMAAEQREYEAGVRAAAAELELGHAVAARNVLIRLPRSQRRWEWAMLLEYAGAPMLRTSNLQELIKYFTKADAKLAQQLSGAANKLPIWQPPNTFSVVPLPYSRNTFTVAPNGAYAAIVNKSRGRHGGFFAVVTGNIQQWRKRFDEEDFNVEELIYSKNPGVIAKGCTYNYGAIEGLAFTQDSSLLILEANPLREYVEPQPVDPAVFKSSTVSVPSKLPSIDSRGPWHYYVIPIPYRVMAGENPVPSSETEEVYTSFSGWRDRCLVALQKKKRWEWPLNQSTLQDGNGCFGAGSDAELGQSRIFAGSLPQQEKERVISLTQVMVVERHIEVTQKRYLADVRQQGANIEAIFMTPNQDAAAELWDLSANRLIRKLGLGVRLSDSNLTIFHNWGAAFDKKGELAILSPVRVADDGLIPGIVRMASGEMVTELVPLSTHPYGRSAHPTFGFSPKNTWVFESFEDAAIPVAGVRTIKPATEAGRNPQEELNGQRFVGWSPSEKWRFEVRSENTELTVIDTDSNENRNSIADAVTSGAYSVFDELNVASEPTENGRFMLGGMLFDENNPDPLLRLPALWVEPSMRHMALKTREKNIQIVTGRLLPLVKEDVAQTMQSENLTAAERILLRWLDLADAQKAKSP